MKKRMEEEERGSYHEDHTMPSLNHYIALYGAVPEHFIFSKFKQKKDAQLCCGSWCMDKMLMERMPVKIARAEKVPVSLGRGGLRDFHYQNI